MGFPRSVSQAVSITPSEPPFNRAMFALLLPTISFLTITHTLTHVRFSTHVPIFPQPFFFTHLRLFFFLNSSLFSAHVYFYPSVHGRSQRNDEAWETLLIAMATILQAFIV